MGPIDDARLNSLVVTGQISPTTLLWREGMPGWLTLDQLRADGGIYLSAPPHLMGPAMMGPTTSGLAIASLVCGIVGLVTCLLIPGIPAVICGHLAMSRIANSPTPIVGRGMALAGLVCGYLSVIILLSGIGMMSFSFASFR